MDALRAAVPLARVFIAAAEGRMDAVIRIRSRSREARAYLKQGRLSALEGVDTEPLGDALLRRGVLDAIRHRAALQVKPPQGKVGPWLVAVGIADAASVRDALEEQLDARMGKLLRWPDAVFEFERTAPETAVPPRDVLVQTDVDLLGCVWLGLLGLARELPAGTLGVLSGDMGLELTRSGARIAQALAASREFDGFESALRRAPSADRRPVRAVLRALGAATDASADSCALLLRKQREVRRQAGARALLDLPPHARSEQARPALRRLAQKLHPDRFQAAAPALRAASGEVMRALSQAERELLTANHARFR
jgi:hypothetical protein